MYISEAGVKLHKNPSDSTLITYYLSAYNAAFDELEKHVITMSVRVWLVLVVTLCLTM